MTDAEQKWHSGPPPNLFCPYCGSSQVKHERGVPRCMNPLCRAVWHLTFSRFMRAPPGARVPMVGP